MSRLNVIKLIGAILITSLAGLIGSIFTTPAIATWYAMLEKPVFNPPNWLFGPVWSLLYILMGIAAFLVWRRFGQHSVAKLALIIFDVQLILNVLWSFIFFGQHNPGAAFVEIILLWLAILMTIFFFAKVSKPAAYLLLPYILWVTFAGVLNYAIWRLNDQPLPNSPQEMVACTLEAQLCPDGSAVGRSGPNCEFAACPVAIDDEDIKVLSCYDALNVYGKDNLPIPCQWDEDCVVSALQAFCQPAEVGFWECGDRDFCGADGFCRHDCRL